MKEVKILFDEKEQRLYMKDASGKVTEIWVMGMGVPAQLMFGNYPKETNNKKTYNQD